MLRGGGSWRAILGIVAGCSSSRAQLVVVVDTDAHLVGALAAHPEVSEAAAIDTLRVDMLDADNVAYATETFLLSEPTQWPVSFGVMPPARGADVRIRLRAFRGQRATAGTALDAPTLDPLPEVTIDRVVVVKVSNGVQRVQVNLAMDCIGTLSSFQTPVKTCIDGATRAGDPSSGVMAVSGVPTSKNGTWRGAIDVPCTTPGSTERACVPGGFTILGDYTFAGTARDAPSAPLRPVVVGPVLMDVHEYTVGRLRALLARGATLPSAPTTQDPNPMVTEHYCTWLGATNAAADAMPLNCVTWEFATTVCDLEGGRLPTEAEWEHEARGRGQERTYPWGRETPECCTLSAGRPVLIPIPSPCGAGVEVVGSHVPSDHCGGDISRDGVVDLGGSLTEACADNLDLYSSPCWTDSGVLRDPKCRQSTLPHSARGSNWGNGVGQAFGAGRSYYVDSVLHGFRCVYPAGVAR